MRQTLQDGLEKLRPLLQKLKYPALVLLIGLILLLLPSKNSRSEEKATETPVQAETPAGSSDDDYRRQTERDLAHILSQIDGAGQVSVMLTLRSSEAVQYQTDFENSNQTGDSVSSTARQTTVILQRSGAYDEAAVVKTEYPQFQGALIVSEGANDPAVRLALENAAAVLLRLGTDKITVVKMK